MPNPPPRTKHDAFTTLSAQHTSGDGLLTVATVGNLPAVFPYYVRCQSGATVCLFKVASAAGSVLTVATADSVADATLPIGTLVANVWTAQGAEDSFTHATTHAHTAADNSAAVAMANVTGTISAAQHATAPGILTAAMLANQSANQVLSGPASGAAAAPSFRAAVIADGVAAGLTSAASVYLSGNTSITQNSLTKIPYDTKVYDNLSEFDAVTNRRFVAGVAGKYLVTASTEWVAALADGVPLQMNLLKNGGTAHILVLGQTGAANKDISCTGSAIVTLAASDYLELWIYHNDSVARSIMGGATSTYAMFHRLCA